MKSKPVKVWVVWRRAFGGEWYAAIVALSKDAAVSEGRDTYRDYGHSCRITSGTVEPPGEGK